MAINPMQKKARNSFLLGMLITFVICAVLVAAFYMLTILPEKKKEDTRGKEVTAYVLNRDIKSGEKVTVDMFTPISTYQSMVPQNYINSANVASLDENKALIAKIDMSKNTVVTTNSVVTEDQTVTNDIRTIEYNMFTLPINVDIGDFVDIRITFPNGQDYIIASKKEIKNIQGNTITFELPEQDILMLNSAIVESYIMTASNIYIAKYVEPGLQEKATNTYTPTAEVVKLIASDSNIVSSAKKELAEKFNTDLRNNDMNSSSSQYSENALTNVEAGLKQQIENAQKAREQYLTGLTDQKTN